MFKLKSGILLLSIVSAVSLPLSLYANTGMTNTNANTETTSQYMNGSAITGKIKTQLLADPDISSFKISVKTEKGVVTLKGVVNTQDQKDKAENIAKNTDGVASVNNQLIVKPNASFLRLYQQFLPLPF